MKTLFGAVLSGSLMGLGLVISGMSNPHKVLSFLNVMDGWDPSLLVVMASATGVTLLGYQWVKKRTSPLFDPQFHVPQNRLIDPPLLMGATLFGLGWGLTGYCPGPALTALIIAPGEGVVFVLAMSAGMALRWRLLPRA